MRVDAERLSDAGSRILTAAADLFAVQGYGLTTTRAIAQRAGVNEVTLFRRFGSKAGVLQRLTEQIAEQTAGTVASGLDSTLDLPAALAALARAELLSAYRNGGLALRLAFDARAIPEVAASLGAGTRDNLLGLTAYLRTHQHSGELRGDIDAELLAEAFFALTSSLVLGRVLLTPSQPPTMPATTAIEALAHTLVGLFLAGARTA